VVVTLHSEKGQGDGQWPSC